MTLAQQQWSGLLDDIRDDNDARDVERAFTSWEQAVESWKAEAIGWQQRALNAEKRALSAEGEVCGGFALQIALEQFVIKCYPAHPLIQDKQLRARIYEAGLKAGSIQNSYGAAREAGRTFAMPYEVLAPLIEAREHNSALDEQLLEEQRKNVELTAQLAAATSTERLQAELRGVIRDCAHHMAQSAAFREQLTQVDPENPLVQKQDGGLRRRIAEEAFAQLERNGGTNWEVVKEVGRTYAIPGRHVAADHDFVHELGGQSEPVVVNPDELHEPPEHLELVGSMEDPVGFLQTRES